MLGYTTETGMLAWALHRITGIGILLFLVVHIADTALIQFGPALYNKVIAVYRLPLFRIGEIFLGGSILFHALNGLRVIIIDFWPSSTVYHKQMFWAVCAVFLATMLPAGYHMLLPLLK